MYVRSMRQPLNTPVYCTSSTRNIHHTSTTQKQRSKQEKGGGGGGLLSLWPCRMSQPTNEEGVNTRSPFSLKWLQCSRGSKTAPCPLGALPVVVKHTHTRARAHTRQGIKKPMYPNAHEIATCGIFLKVNIVCPLVHFVCSAPRELDVRSRKPRWRGEGSTGGRWKETAK